VKAAESNELDRLDPRDREYVESLEGAQRQVVVSTILRYQRDTILQVGDPLPVLGLRRLDDDNRVALRDLLEGRPLVLVFGSFT
jgi:hypothetical protein